jgi:hypothetical protein
MIRLSDDARCAIVGYYTIMWTRANGVSALVGGLAAIGATVIAVGCSTRQDAPATPSDTATTPTFRSSTYSYDQPNSPYYTQPGLNGGTSVTLPSIPATNRFDQNTPLASEVYGELQQKIGSEHVRYVTVQSKGSAVLIGGTATSAELVAKVVSVVKRSAGVASVTNHIKVQSQ